MKQRIRIAHLDLVDFRGFEHLSVDFDEQLTVFIGNNGSGKTTILEAVAACLQYVKEQVQDHAQKDIFNDSDIRIAHGVDTFDINLSFSEPPARLNASYIRRGRPSFNFMAISNDEPDYEIEATLKTWYKDNKSLEIIAYYPCQAISVENGQAVNFNVFNVENAYDEALDGRFNFSMLNKWLIWQYSLRQERGTNVFFDHISEAIIGEHGILNDQDKRHFDALRVTYQSKPEGALLFVKDNAELAEYQLSSGEKMLFALVADIGRRLIIANPNSKNPLEEGSGVVLIDEIDLHLHPSWQQKVVGKLRSIFPKVQFVMTTHSAEVLKGLERKHLRIIKNHRIISVTPYIQERDTNSILFDAFDVSEHSPEYEEKIKELYRLMETDTAAAEKLLAELKEVWGETDAQIMRAESYLEIF